MRRFLSILFALSLILGLSKVTVRAQEGLTGPEQAALAEIHLGVQRHYTLPRFVASVSERVEQKYFERSAGRTYQLDQIVTTEGTLNFVSVPGSRYNDQQLDLMRTVRSTAQGKSIGTGDVMQIDARILANQILIKIQDPSVPQGFYPSEWATLPADREQWPGLAFIDAQGLTTYSRVIDPRRLEPPYDGVYSVKRLDVADAEGKDVIHYQVALDPQIALETFGPGTFAGMFSLDAPFEVSSYVDLAFLEPSTSYVADFTIRVLGASLYEIEKVEQHFYSDVAIPKELVAPNAAPDVEQRIILDFTRSVIFDTASRSQQFDIALRHQQLDIASRSQQAPELSQALKVDQLAGDCQGCNCSCCDYFFITRVDYTSYGCNGACAPHEYFAATYGSARSSAAGAAFAHLAA